MKIVSKNFSDLSKLEDLMQDLFFPVKISSRELDDNLIEYNIESKLRADQIEDQVNIFKSRVFSENSSMIKRNKKMEISVRISWVNEEDIKKDKEMRLETARSNDIKLQRVIKAIAKQSVQKMLYAIAASAMLTACGAGTPETEGKYNKNYSAPGTASKSIEGNNWENNSKISDDEKLMIKRILDKAEEMGVKSYVEKNVNKLNGIEWVENIGGEASNVMGRCEYFSNGRNIKMLKPNKMKEQLSYCFDDKYGYDLEDDDKYILTELVLWHELGHCAGNLKHLEDPSIEIMNETISCEHIVDFKINYDLRINNMIESFKMDAYSLTDFKTTGYEDLFGK